jgi:hypothetical protein
MTITYAEIVQVESKGRRESWIEFSDGEIEKGYSRNAALARLARGKFVPVTENFFYLKTK